MAKKKSLERYLRLEIEPDGLIMIKDSSVKPRDNCPKFYKPNTLLGGNSGKFILGDIYKGEFKSEKQYDKFNQDLESVYGFMNKLVEHVTGFNNLFSRASLIDVVNFLEQSPFLTRMPAQPWLEDLPNR